MNSEIIYEQPLNERIRTFLRLSHLFRLNEHFMSGHTEWDIRSVVDSLLDINDLIGRTDIKNEIIKELERHSSTLNALKKNPGVDRSRLDLILGDISENIEELRDQNCQPGLALRQDELINSVKQRNAILGGSCNFDIPAYHHWLNSPPEQLKTKLIVFQQDIRVIKRSIFLIINLIRNSSNPTIEVAEKGFFQKSIEQNIGCQLIRIILPHDSLYFPEISAGKHRFTIRFMVQDETAERPVQAESDLEFQLHCCIL
ncbi:MAG: cell division protein ZapD [Gammaproteobacteria bacterium]|nr:cell division protein ZapD [Gammaproteobacteria bacterium]